MPRQPLSTDCPGPPVRALGAGLSFAFFFLAGSMLGAEPTAKKDAGPKDNETSGFLVLPYLQLPTPTSMTVMWETTAELPGQVEYGLTRALGSTTAHPRQTDLHEIPLKGLKPGTTYYYRVRSGKLVSAIYSFKTAPPPGTRRWRLAVYGDSRSNPRVHRKVAEQIARAKVDLIVHTGDIVLNGKIHLTWQLEFFRPLGELARSVPWVSTIGNHERDSEHYFSYMALPGNERYFGFDYANAHLICLDSNAWIAKGRDSRQYRWLEDHLKQKRAATWTFVAFHHPLFSAHTTRPINALRWDWAPLFLDPANRVDGVLTGHDHFYARNFRMGRLSATPGPGVLFLTTGGGGAGLYPCTQRDYVARTRSVHHFTLFDFDGDRVKISAIDINGTVFDSYEFTRQPPPAAEFCAYEIEELKRYLRLALAKQEPLRPTSVRRKKTAKEKGGASPRFRIAGVLTVPTRFPVPVSGSLRWARLPGWKMPNPVTRFRLKPGQALAIPLQAEVAAAALGQSPALTIAFAAGKFRNRLIEVRPFKVAGPERVSVGKLNRSLVWDAQQVDRAWDTAPANTLLPLAPDQNQAKEKADRVQWLADKDWFYLRVVLSDVGERVEVPAPDPCAEGSSLVLMGEHVRLVLADGKRTRTFAVSPDSLRYASGGQEEDSTRDWRALVSRTRKSWCVQMAIARKLVPELGKVRVNVVHRRRQVGVKLARRYVDAELCPAYLIGNDPDLIPDWRPGTSAKVFAPLVLK